MPDYPHAIESYVDRSRVFINTNDHQAIVLHATAGGSSAQNIAGWFANDPNMASSHYIVGQDGTVVQVVREVDGACANCCKEPGNDPFWDQWNDNLNWHTLSIEHVNADLHNAFPLTDIQKQESFKLVKYLVDKYNIPLDHIKGHNSIAPLNRHDCPGPAFPWTELMQYLRGANMNTYDTNPHIKQEFDQCWDSTASLFGGTPPRKNTGIHVSWVTAWLDKGYQFGPPLTQEYSSVDGVGSPLTVQQFAGARCEWSNGAPHWYTTTGPV